MTDLDRFVKAQETTYLKALSEIKNGKKQSHFMWYIFSQIRGLSMSEMSRYYGISCPLEANDYLNHEILGSRLREITSELLKLNEDNPESIFGLVDAMKLKSCMTLFDYVSSFDIFKDVLDKFYGGKVDEKTIFLCNKSKSLIYKKQ